MTEHDQSRPGPIFVGGSPRSGTHAMGRLVGSHPDFALVPVEARFHAARKGLSDLVAGESSFEEFVTKCRGFWFQRGSGRTNGLRRIVSREDFDAALSRFEAEYERDPLGSCRRLAHELIDPVAEAAGKRSWVEVTGANIRSGPNLLPLFPEAKFIHMIRDGRAVAASIVHKQSMTDDPMRALMKHWYPRIRDSDAAARRMPAGSVIAMRLEDLAADAREESYRRVADIVGEDPAMRAYFDSSISASAAHHGQWRERLSEQDAERVDRAYRELIRGLHRDGVASAPSPSEIGIGDDDRPGRIRDGLRAAGARVRRELRR